MGAEHGGGTNVGDGDGAGVSAHAGGVVVLAGGVGEHLDHARGESGHHGEVQLRALAVNNDRDGSGGNELNVGLIVLELDTPVVDLDAGDDGVVGLCGVHGLGDEVLQVLQIANQSFQYPAHIQQAGAVIRKRHLML